MVDPMPGKGRILIVDDAPELREVLAGWFAQAGYLVDEAADGLEAMARLRARPADVVVTDLKMPHVDGLQLLGVIEAIAPATAVIFLSGEATTGDVIQALREGRAWDFLLKPLRSIRDLEVAVERALRHRAATGPVSPAPSPPAALPAGPPAVALTGRERDIVALLAEGHDNRAIAARLYLSEKTVKNALTQVYDKLGVSSRTQAVLACQRQGLVRARA